MRLIQEQPESPWFIPRDWLLFKYTDEKTIRSLYRDPRMPLLEDGETNR